MQMTVKVVDIFDIKKSDQFSGARLNLAPGAKHS